MYMGPAGPTAAGGTPPMGPRGSAAPPPRSTCSDLTRAFTVWSLNFRLRSFKKVSLVDDSSSIATYHMPGKVLSLCKDWGWERPLPENRARSSSSVASAGRSLMMIVVRWATWVGRIMVCVASRVTTVESFTASTSCGALVVRNLTLENSRMVLMGTKWLPFIWDTRYASVARLSLEK